MTATALEILQGARVILDDPKRWYQGHFSNDDDTAFCSLGAIREASEALGGGSYVLNSEARRTLDDAIRQLYPEYIARNVLPHHEFLSQRDANGVYTAYWNDATDRTHEQVIKTFNAAIALAKERQPIAA